MVTLALILSLMSRIRRALVGCSAVRQLGRKTPAEAPALPADHWIAEEQWVAGFPGDCRDRHGWSWWGGPIETAMAKPASHW